MIIPSMLRIHDVMVIVVCEIYLTADDGFDGRMFPGFLDEFRNAIQKSVIGNGQTRLSELLGS